MLLVTAVASMLESVQSDLMDRRLAVGWVAFPKGIAHAERPLGDFDAAVEFLPGQAGAAGGPVVGNVRQTRLTGGRTASFRLAGGERSATR